MKPRVIFFGASQAGLDAFDALRTRVKVLAFADNDSAKHGTKICGIPVISPMSLNARSIDGVVITSMYVEQIHAQLLELKIPPEMIHVYGSNFEDVRPLFPWDALIFLSICGMVVTAMFIFLVVQLCAG